MIHFLVWKDDWNTGIATIDEMHRLIVDKLNQVIALCAQPDILSESSKFNKYLKPALSELMDVTRHHFISEEETMRESNYPAYASHKKEHQILLAEMTQLIREINNNGTKPENIIHRDLKHWFIAHTIISDRAFAKHYHTQNKVPLTIE